MKKATCKVSFRIIGEFLEPQNVTYSLEGLTPSASHKNREENAAVRKKDNL